MEVVRFTRNFGLVVIKSSPSAEEDSQNVPFLNSRYIMPLISRSRILSGFQGRKPTDNWLSWFDDFVV